MESRAKQLTRYACSILYIGAGANHFANTDFYVSIVPPYLPAHLMLVYLSGIAEIGLGLLLMPRGSSRLAGWGLMVLLIAVFPANVHMALHPNLYSWAAPSALWARLPVQALLIAWAYWYTRGASGREAGRGGSRDEV